MKHNIPLNTLPLTASEAIPAHRAVTLAAQSGCVRLAQAGDWVLGISGPYEAAVGRAVDVVTAGCAPCEFSTAAAIGAFIGVTANGMVGVVAQAKAFGAVADAVVAGDVEGVYLKPPTPSGQ